MKDAKKEVEQLMEEYLVMLYGKKSFYKKSEYFKVKQLVLICVSKQFELLRYLGSKGYSQLYDYLVEQKKEIQKILDMNTESKKSETEQCNIPDVSIMCCDLGREFHQCEVHRCSTYGCLNCGQYRKQH